jgi:transposase InsO family protein
MPTAKDILAIIKDRVREEFQKIKEIRTDHGPQFSSKSWIRTLRANNIAPLITSVNHPESNGLAEKQIRNINTKKRSYLLEIPDIDWAFVLPIITHAIRLRPQGSIFGLHTRSCTAVIQTQYSARARKSS